MLIIIITVREQIELYVYLNKSSDSILIDWSVDMKKIISLALIIFSLFCFSSTSVLAQSTPPTDKSDDKKDAEISQQPESSSRHKNNDPQNKVESSENRDTHIGDSHMDHAVPNLKDPIGIYMNDSSGDTP